VTDWTPVADAPEPIDELVLHDLALVDELTHPVRSQLLHRLRHPHSAAELADALAVPVTRLYHHLNRLEEIGLIAVVATRRSGAKTERRYQATARSVRVDRDAIAGKPPVAVGQALGVLFDVAKAELRHEVETGAIDPETLQHSGGLALVELSLSPERRNQFVERMQSLVKELLTEQSDDDPNAIRYRVLVAGFPLSR